MATTKTTTTSVPPHWRVHTANLLREVLANKGTAIMTKPLNMLQSLLAKVAERAIELNDPALNALMCRLTLYSCADPESPDYDPAVYEEVIRKGKGWR